MTDRELMQEALESIKWLRVHLERDHGCLHMKPAASGITDWLSKTEASLCARLAQLNDFNPDWDAMAVMVEEQQRMAKRIEELTQLVTSQGIRLMDAEAQPETVGINEVILDSIRDSSEVVAPPQREWVGLTREELAEIAEFHFHGALSAREFYDDIEAKLKEKNT